MIRLSLVTQIAAPIERCFDLSRSIDAHILSTAGSEEKAVAGVTRGLIGMNEQVTWRGKHFGRWITHTSRITAFDPPRVFQDAMVSGAFKSFRHDHHFESQNNVTVMRDDVQFEAPYGWLGKLAERLVLAGYLRKVLERRNLYLKQIAESDDWKKFLM